MAEETTGRKVPVPAIVGAVVLVVAAVAAFMVLGAKKQVEVPELVYLSQEDAQKAIEEAGLKVGTVTEKETQEYFDGYVIRQDPEAKKQAEEGSTVDITIAKGYVVPETITVPDLRGMTTDEAEKALGDAWIIPVPGEAVYSDDVEPGKVCSQSIAAGTVIDFGMQKVEAGDFVKVTYSTSLGKEQVVVPDVTGKNVNDARTAIEGAGLVVDSSTSYSDDVAQDVVISQSIPKDTQVAKGTVVALVVSLGKKPVERVQVPWIMTYTLADAKRALESAGLKYTYSGDENGKVVSVNPIPGTEVDQGSTVTFALEVPAPTPEPTPEPEPEPEPTPEPTPTYITKQDAENVALEALDSDLNVDGVETTFDDDEGIYEVSIRLEDFSVYIYEIDATNGAVISARAIA